MNQFEHEETQIIKSRLDFSRVSEQLSFSSNVALSGVLQYSKDLEQSPDVLSKAILELGGENERVFIHVEIVSVFRITHLEKETLRQDAEAFCRPYTIRELTRKIADLTKLHIGTSLQLQIPDDLAFEETPPPSGA